MTLIFSREPKKCALRRGMRAPIVTAALALLAATPGGAAVTLELSSATVARQGDSARVCVSLVTDGEEVAATQNDLDWALSCATLPTEASCAVAGAHGKDLYVRLLHYDVVRALILSLTDIDPIHDGPLYCCDFIADALGCCPVALINAGASDLYGNAIAVADAHGEICVRATPRPTPTAVPGANDDGCQVAPAVTPAAGPWLFAALLLLLRRRRKTPTG